MFKCGFVRSNFALALVVASLGEGVWNPEGELVLARDGYSPRTRATISVAIDSGTCWYESNCIV